jgi:CRISPR type I-E-associated protein CasB/Cse2
MCLAEAVARDPRRQRTIEERLDLLVKQSVEGIHRHLPATVAFIADRPDAVHFPSLLGDLRDWESGRDRIGRRWMQTYYRERKRAAAQTADRADAEETPAGDDPAA